MPTVVISPPGGIVAPGISLTVVSDFIGPIQPGSFWQIIILDHTDETALNHWRSPFVTKSQEVALSIENLSTTSVGVAIPDGKQVDVRAQISTPTGIADTGISGVFTWNNTANLPQLLKELQGESTGGSFTAEDRALLQETQLATFPTLSLDAMLLQELTSGPTGGFVAANLGAWIYGVIVRVATVPPELVPTTPDGDYWVHSLAIVRIYRGSDLWKRVPVHTSSKLISFVEEGLVTAVTAIVPVQWLLQMSVQVTFAEGVTGQVFLMEAP